MTTRAKWNWICAKCGKPVAHNDAMAKFIAKYMPRKPTAKWHLECSGDDLCAPWLLGKLMTAEQIISQIEERGSGRVRRDGWSRNAEIHVA